MARKAFKTSLNILFERSQPSCSVRRNPSGGPRLPQRTLEEVKRKQILSVLRESGGVVTSAARRLGLHWTLNAMKRKLGISRKTVTATRQLTTRRQWLGLCYSSSIRQTSADELTHRKHVARLVH
jgi:hypothetical protein